MPFPTELQFPALGKQSLIASPHPRWLAPFPFSLLFGIIIAIAKHENACLQSILFQINSSDRKAIQKLKHAVF